MEQDHWDVIVIGGGSAGLSAALVLSRARRRVLVIDAAEPRNRFAGHMHGVLGRDGWSPLELVRVGREEVAGYGGEIVQGRVTAVSSVGDRFEVVTDAVAGGRASARRLVVATGLRDELPAVSGLAEHWGEGAVACPYCDGWESRDRRLGVIPTGEMSAHYAQMIRHWSPDVTLFTGLLGDAAPSGEDLRLLAARGVRIEPRGIRRVVGERGALEGVELVDGAVVEVDRLFVKGSLAAGSTFVTDLGAEMTEMQGVPVPVRDATGRTTVPGLWAIGNAANPAALVPIAIGEGVAAATAVNADLIFTDLAAL